MNKVVLLVVFFFLFRSSYSQIDSGVVNFTILDDESNEPVHCNARIKNAAGQPFFPDSNYFWKSFMGEVFPDYPNDGTFSIKLPAGKYNYEIDRGPEYTLASGNVEVQNQDLNIVLRLKRIADMKKNNWWPGELHVHRKLKDIEFLMKCSDLHVAPVITSWNEHYHGDVSVYNGTPKQFDAGRFYTASGSEDERAGGAILVLNTPKPIDFSDAKPSFPPLAASAEKVKTMFGNNAWVDVEKPYWWDIPVLLATGKIQSVGIANNHMNRDGVFNNEAWGKARDTVKYPFPRGNGYYAQDIYYHMVNAGIKIAPSAGSASGVLMNPVGYNRVYAYVENGLTYDKWFKSLEEEKVFITNGPMLICKANNQYPGKIFTSSKAIKLKIDAGIISRDSIDMVEIIKNGKIYKTIPGSQLKNGKYLGDISFDQSGWFLVRVICKTPGNFRFASTAPFHVKIKGKKYISRSSAQFFLDWTNQRAGLIKIDDPKEAAIVTSYIDAARKFWQHLVNTATAE